MRQRRTTVAGDELQRVLTPESVPLDLEGERIRGLVSEKLFGESAEPVRVGRFTVLERIGAGGMGAVYAAQDKQLDRKVAIKLLHRETGAEEASGRLLREAQALARLSHPNVVTVHEVGFHDGRLYMAMEFIDGMTLRDWLKRGPRNWREIRDRLLEAARGLEAAHKVDLIHRDFKPDNVVIDENRRTRVVDFGLARGEQPLPAESGDFAEDLAELAALSPAVTRTGAVLGTPAYMSPEQISRDAMDARTDQFSFCVTLYEALYGERPFAGTTLREIVRNVQGGHVRQPKAGVRIPGWLRRALLRGISTSREDRYPTMEALIADLSRDLGSGKRRALMTGVGVALIAAVAWSAERSLTDSSVTCPDESGAFVGIWDDERRAQARAAFMANDRSYAEDIVIRATQELDRYTEGWIEARHEACQATHVREEQPIATMDLRNECLDRSFAQLRAMTDLFVIAHGNTVERAIESLARLRPVSDCADPNKLATMTAAPTDASREQYAELRGALARGTMLVSLGSYREASEQLDAVHARAEEFGMASLLAEVAVARGAAFHFLSQNDKAEAELQRAVRLALETENYEVAASAWSQLISLLSFVHGRFEEAELLASYAESALGDRPGHEAALAGVLARRGVMYAQQNKLDKALADQLGALDVRKSILSENHPDVGYSEYFLGDLRIMRGEYDEALEHFRSAETILKAALTDRHAFVAFAKDGQARVLQRQGKYEEAVPLLHEALALAERALGPNSERVAGLCNNVGLSLMRAKNWEAALAHFRRAAAIHTRVLGPGHPSVMQPLINIGNTYRMQDRFDEALAAFERVQALIEGSLGKDHPMLASPIEKIGLTYIDLGRREAGLDHLERSKQISEVQLGKDNPRLVYVLLAIAKVEVELGRFSDAAATAGRLLEIGEPAGVEANILTTARRVQKAAAKRSRDWRSIPAE